MSAARPGELIHIDVKKLARIERDRARVSGRRRRNPAHPTQGVCAAHVGWEFVHIAIDDAPVWPTSRSSRRERRSPSSAFSDVPSPLRPPRHHRRAVASLTTARATDPRHPRDRLPRARHPSPTHSPVPATDQRQKLNASFAPCSVAGPTARSTATAPNATPHSPAGSTSTITKTPRRHQPQTAHRSPQRANNLLGTYS